MFWFTFFNQIFSYICYLLKESNQRYQTAFGCCMHYWVKNPFIPLAVKTAWLFWVISLWYEFFSEDIHRRNVNPKFKNNSPSNIFPTHTSLFESYFQKYQRSRQQIWESCRHQKVNPMMPAPPKNRHGCFQYSIFRTKANFWKCSLIHQNWTYNMFICVVHLCSIPLIFSKVSVIYMIFFRGFRQ